MGAAFGFPGRGGGDAAALLVEAFAGERARDQAAAERLGEVERACLANAVLARSAFDYVATTAAPAETTPPADAVSEDVDGRRSSSLGTLTTGVASLDEAAGPASPRARPKLTWGQQLSTMGLVSQKSSADLTAAAAAEEAAGCRLTAALRGNIADALMCASRSTSRHGANPWTWKSTRRRPKSSFPARCGAALRSMWGETTDTDTRESLSFDRHRSSSLWGATDRNSSDYSGAYPLRPSLFGPAASSFDLTENPFFRAAASSVTVPLGGDPERLAEVELSDVLRPL
jgi:hypothetical protein